jgi:hypothetical protein
MSFGILHSVAPVRTDASEEYIASICKVTISYNIETNYTILTKHGM